MKRWGALALLLALQAAAGVLPRRKKGEERQPRPTALDRYVREALAEGQGVFPSDASPGSLWTPSSLLADASRDTRAGQTNDLVTIVVSETASAVSTGATKTARAAAANNSITALAGPLKAGGALANLTGLKGSSSLDGAGSTTRTTTVNTTLSARVSHVLPNGYLVVEGTKTLFVNSEYQVITIRGVARPADLTAANTIQSGQLAQLEVAINGRGVVNDSIRRPNFLYRLLLGLLPF